jgi:hypothetical protein
MLRFDGLCDVAYYCPRVNVQLVYVYNNCSSANNQTTRTKMKSDYNAIPLSVLLHVKKGVIKKFKFYSLDIFYRHSQSI